MKTSGIEHVGVTVSGETSAPCPVGWQNFAPSFSHDLQIGRAPVNESMTRHKFNSM
jgi:hypothetical protein